MLLEHSEKTVSMNHSHTVSVTSADILSTVAKLQFKTISYNAMPYNILHFNLALSNTIK